MGLRSASSAISDHCCVDRKVFMTKDFADFLIKQNSANSPFHVFEVYKRISKIRKWKNKRKNDFTHKPT